MDMPSSSSSYSVRQIIQYQMFAFGDVEYPIEECIDFVNDFLIARMSLTVQKCIKSMEKRESTKPEMVDLLIQYKNNPKLLKRMYEYVYMVSCSSFPIYRTLVFSLCVDLFIFIIYQIPHFLHTGNSFYYSYIKFLIL